MSSVEALRKINIGCGYDKKPGYLNIDMDPCCRPDVLIVDNDLSQLPRKSFEELYANDVLEHIKRADSLASLLEWADLMCLGGEIELQTSNALAVADLMRQNWKYHAHADYTTWLWGNQMHAGDYHHTGFTDLTLRVLATAAGFAVDEMETRGLWLLWMKGRKVSDWTELLESGAEYDNAKFVHAAYGAALYREPEPVYHELLTGWLDAGTSSRRDVLKHLFSSPERGLATADRLGL